MLSLSLQEAILPDEMAKLLQQNPNIAQVFEQHSAVVTHVEETKHPDFRKSSDAVHLNPTPYSTSLSSFSPLVAGAC